MPAATAFHRNWAAIKNVADEATRRALVLCRDQATLERLRLSFPECFGDEPRIPIPLSTLIDLNRDFCLSNRVCDPEVVEHWARYALDAICEVMDIPIVAHWSVDDGNPTPQSVIDQLVGRPMKPGLVVTYLGANCLVTWLSIGIYGGPPDIQERDPLLRADPDDYALVSLAPAECFILDI